MVTAAANDRVEKKLDDIITRLTRLEERGDSRDREQATISEYTRTAIERLEKRLDAQDLVRAAEYQADMRTALAERSALDARLKDLEVKDSDREKEAATNRRLIVASFLAPIIVGVMVALIVAAVLGGS
jgi:predicted ribosome quality control (RQC) complex YloA/Tae2 family protein